MLSIKTNMRFIIIIISTLLSACGNDVRPPEIILSGKTKDTIELNSPYSEPGYIAKDKKDGDITHKVIVTGYVNPNKIGNYTVKYEVMDKAGNTAKAQRNINVFNKVNNLEGNYNVSEIVKGANPGKFNYSVNVKSSEIKNYELEINNFGSYGIHVNVKANVNGNTLSIPLQSPNGMPTGSEGAIEGTGEIENNVITKINFICFYLSGGSDTVNCIYTKQ